MPATTAKQYKFLQMIKNRKKTKKSNKSDHSIGPSAEVADEMIKKTPKEKRSLFMKDTKRLKK